MIASRASGSSSTTSTTRREPAGPEKISVRETRRFDVRHRLQSSGPAIGDKKINHIRDEDKKSGIPLDIAQPATHHFAHMLKVLVVEDEQDLCALIADTLVDEGYDVTCAKDGAEAMAAASAATVRRRSGRHAASEGRRPDAVSLAARRNRPTTDVIVMTGNAAVADAVAVLKEGAFDYLTKPFNLDELGVQLQRLAHLPVAAAATSPRCAAELTRAGVEPRPAGRPLAGDARARQAHGGDRAQRRGGGHHGRERNRQGAGGARAARGRRAPVEAVRRRQLRRVPRHADRGGAVRARARRVHRRHQSPGRPVQGGARRHAVPGRGRGAVAGGAGQAAARAAGRDDRAAGQQRYR